jgi:hypothetical protein
VMYTPDTDFLRTAERSIMYELMNQNELLQ